MYKREPNESPWGYYDSETEKDLSLHKWWRPKGYEKGNSSASACENEEPVNDDNEGPLVLSPNSPFAEDLMKYYRSKYGEPEDLKVDNSSRLDETWEAPTPTLGAAAAGKWFTK
jgi:hypothetical protein